MPASRSGRAGIRRTFLLVFAAAALLPAGCGIPSYPSLSPPVVSPDDFPPPESGLLFSFAVPTDNDATIFKGFEFYYRIYSGLDIDEAALTDDLRAIIDMATLEQRGYRRCYPNTATTASGVDRPLVTLDDAQKTDEALVVYIDFSPLINAQSPSAFPVVQVAATEYPLARNVSEDPNTPALKGFLSSDFAESDADIPDDYLAESPNSRATALYVSLYVLSYGNDPASFQFNIYSPPAYLGYIAIPG